MAPGPLALSPVRSKYRAQGQRAQDKGQDFRRRHVSVPSAVLRAGVS